MPPITTSERDGCSTTNVPVRVPSLLRVRLDLGRVQHERLDLVLGELLLGRGDEHRLREQRVVRAGGDDADADAVLGIGAGEGVHDVRASPAR